MQYKSYPIDTEASLLFECRVLSSREATCHLTAVSRQEAGIRLLSRSRGFGGPRSSLCSWHTPNVERVSAGYMVLELWFIWGEIWKRGIPDKALKSSCRLLLPLPSPCPILSSSPLPFLPPPSSPAPRPPLPLPTPPLPLLPFYFRALTDTTPTTSAPSPALTLVQYFSNIHGPMTPWLNCSLWFHKSEMEILHSNKLPDDDGAAGWRKASMTLGKVWEFRLLPNLLAQPRKLRKI